MPSTGRYRCGVLILFFPPAHLGRQTPESVDSAGHGFTHRAHEEGGQNLAQPPRADPQLLPGEKAVLQWRRWGFEQQDQSDHEKILRVSHLQNH